MAKEHEEDEHICEEEEEEEEEYILLELDDCLYSDIQPNAPYILSGLDSLTPSLVVGDGLKMIGEYEETVGTCYLFSESDAEPKPIHGEAALAKENKDRQGQASKQQQGRNEGSSSKEGMKEAPPKEVKHLATVQKILKFRPINEDYQQRRAYQHKDKGF